MSTTSNSSAARMLMQGLGQVSKMTGMAITSSSVIYVMKYMLIFGCCLLEYLPHLYGDTDVNFVSHLKSNNHMSLMAVFKTACILFVGIFFRKIGTVLTNELNIATVEKTLYGDKQD